LGLVGESGCGKSTIGRTILGVQRETSGEIRLDGRVVSGLLPHEARIIRRDIQYAYQDPGAALDPWWSIGGTLHEGLKINGVSDAAERGQRISEVLGAVGLDDSFLKRYPHELSGGQLRRIGLARILVLRPRIVILDEPTSGLDPSVQATVLRLLRDLRERYALTYLFISHDLSVVQRMCDRVAIMYLGKIVEQADTANIFGHPVHPYTRALLASAPRLDPGAMGSEKPIEGEPPNPAAVPSGCAFRNRCPYAREVCAEAVPPLDTFESGHRVACVRWRDVDREARVDSQTATPDPRLPAE
jgi:oligopeptide/dipeptide ABC transporter ATP-binding protein